MPDSPHGAELTLDEAIGQLVCPTLAWSGDRPYDEALQFERLEKHGWGGYIVFHTDRDQLRERIARLQARSPLPLLVAADLEHGAGQQVRGLSVFPAAMAFGAAGSSALVREMAAHTAREALSVGINWIFAPVADVTSNPLNPIINIRSFGGDPYAVAALVAAFVEGCQEAGALACAKHFPGHGDTATDSHSRLGIVAADRARLEAVELPPFRAAIGAGVASIMTAHLALPAVGIETPATLSHAVMTGLLREELRFGGLVVTDALVMGGIVNTLDPLQAAVKAVAAGCDMLLMPPDPVATFEALREAVAEGRLAEARVKEAAGRVLAAKGKLVPGTAPSGPDLAGAEMLAHRVARQALTLARGNPALRLPHGTVAVAVDDGVEGDRLDAWRAAVARHGLVAGPVVSIETPEPEWAALARRVEDAPMLLVGAFSPIHVSKDRSLLPAALVEHLRRVTAGRATVIASFSSPFLVAEFPEAEAWVLTYGTRSFQVEAALAALSAGGPYPGQLPVAIPEWLAAPEAAGEARRGPSFA